MLRKNCPTTPLSEMLFNEKGNTLERFINEVNSEDRNVISRYIHDFISWLKARLKGEKVSLKIVKLENRFAAVLRNVDNTSAQKNNTTNDGDVQYSNYWYPQMSKTDLEYVKRRAKYELDTTENYIDNITKWLYNVKNGNTYFALYSTEDANEPTILYACKANRAKNEQAWFVRFIEELRSIDNGNYEQSTSVLNQMLETFWNEYKSNNRHSGNGLGRGSNNRNVRATNQKTNFKPSEALFNCLRNIAKISDTDGADLNKGSAFSMPENDGNSYSFGDNERYAEYDKPITPGDIRLLREIGRKSINEFTPEEIEIAQKWAYKFYQQLGTKSPFFRRWFGDWRAYDKTPVVIVDVPSMEFNSQEFKDFVLSQRGNVVNNDTKTTDKAGWTIRISGEGQRNTIYHSGGKRLSAKGLAAIQKLIENAVLLDSEVHEHHSNNSKSENTDRITFDHRLYSLGKKSDGSIALYRITVEEIFKNQKQPDDMRFHNLKYIEKVADNIGSLTADKQHAESASDVSTTNYSVCDLYGFVKEFDADFTAGKTVSRSQLNEDGTPKMLYHQTADEFTEFDIRAKIQRLTLPFLNR